MICFFEANNFYNMFFNSLNVYVYIRQIELDIVAAFRDYVPERSDVLSITFPLFACVKKKCKETWHGPQVFAHEVIFLHRERERKKYHTHINNALLWAAAESTQREERERRKRNILEPFLFVLVPAHLSRHAGCFHTSAAAKGGFCRGGATRAQEEPLPDTVGYMMSERAARDSHSFRFMPRLRAASRPRINTPSRPAWHRDGFRYFKS